MRSTHAGRMLGVIHQDQAVSEALASAVDVRRHAPLSQAAADIAQCTRELLARLASTGMPPQ
jgi:cellulose biosynthesis protein BcsQ